MKGVLFIKVLKAKKNITKDEIDNASQDTAYHQDDLYSIVQPVSKIVYLDQEVSSHKDEGAFNPMDVDDEQIVPGVFAFKVHNDGSIDKKMEIELYDGDSLHGVATQKVSTILKSIE